MIKKAPTPKWMLKGYIFSSYGQCLPTPNHLSHLSDRSLISSRPKIPDTTAAQLPRSATSSIFSRQIPRLPQPGWKRMARSLPKLNSIVIGRASFWWRCRIRLHFPDNLLPALSFPGPAPLFSLLTPRILSAQGALWPVRHHVILSHMDAVAFSHRNQLYIIINDQRDNMPIVKPAGQASSR